MSKRPALFTQADVARTLRAVQQCDYDGVVEIGRDGAIRIIPPAALGHIANSDHDSLDDSDDIEL